MTKKARDANLSTLVSPVEIRENFWEEGDYENGFVKECGIVAFFYGAIDSGGLRNDTNFAGRYCHSRESAAAGGR